MKSEQPLVQGGQGRADAEGCAGPLVALALCLASVCLLIAWVYSLAKR